MLFASAAVLMVGCEKETTTPSNGGSSNQQTSTYTLSVSGIQVPSGMALEVLAVEYSASNERLQINRFDLTSSSMSKNYTANSRTEKVKVAFNASNPNTGQTASLWIQQVFYLDKGKKYCHFYNRKQPDRFFRTLKIEKYTICKKKMEEAV